MPAPFIKTKGGVYKKPEASLFLHSGGQFEVYNNPSRFKVVVAGRRWGKSQLSKVSMIRYAAANRNSKVWYVAPTYQMARQIMWSELTENMPKGWIVSVNETRMEITLANGSTIALRGADKPDAMRGITSHFVVLDEFQDMKPETWSEVMRPTLATTGGGALIIGTPKSFNHLYDLYMKGQREDNRRSNQWYSWTFRTIDSPFIPPEEIAQAKGDLDERVFAQEYEASFVSASNLVYHAFDRSVNVRACKFDPTKPIWIGMDFNIDPMSAIIMQPQSDGVVHAVSEVFRNSSNTQEMAERLDKMYFKYQRQVEIYPDPAGSQRSHGRGESDLDILRQTGFKKILHRRKHPRISDRVNAVNRMLKSADGRVRLYIDPQCKNLINSFEQTQYKPGSRDIDKRAGKEHATDAIGYPIELRFPVRTSRWMGGSI